LTAPNAICAELAVGRRLACRFQAETLLKFARLADVLMKIEHDGLDPHFRGANPCHRPDVLAFSALNGPGDGAASQALTSAREDFPVGMPADGDLPVYFAITLQREET
jgi:hypothetical protein